MTKTAENDSRPCWRCDGTTFWRDRGGTIHCSHCEAPHAAWLIAQRLRAIPVRPRSLGGRCVSSCSNSREPERQRQGGH